MSIGTRLRSKRERLGLSQAAFGELGGAGKSTVQSWERGDATPNAEFLSVLSAAGADVLYIVTGQRQQQPKPIKPKPLPNPITPDQVSRAVIKHLHAIAGDRFIQSRAQLMAGLAKATHEMGSHDFVEAVMRVIAAEQLVQEITQEPAGKRTGAAA